tara:strand:- start:47 stop:355 length:309 start_codon:yes stop_codon:yes gene_type:complete
MHSTIKNHSIEAATDTGVKTGKFYLNKSAARGQAHEILKTHMGLEGQKAEDYLNENFDKAWNHADVNNENKVEADRMPGVYRMLTGNQMIPLYAQKKAHQKK